MFNIDKELNTPDRSEVMNTAMCLQEYYLTTTQQLSAWSAVVQEYNKDHGVAQTREMITLLAEKIETAFCYLSKSVGHSHFLVGAYDLDILPVVADKLSELLGYPSITEVTASDVAGIMFAMMPGEYKDQIGGDDGDDRIESILNRFRRIVPCSKRELLFALRVFENNRVTDRDISRMTDMLKIQVTGKMGCK